MALPPDAVELDLVYEIDFKKAADCLCLIWVPNGCCSFIRGLRTMTNVILGKWFCRYSPPTTPAIPY